LWQKFGQLAFVFVVFQKGCTTHQQLQRFPGFAGIQYKTRSTCLCSARLEDEK